jgi:sugar-specific transcriptional regulator TrmB
MAVNQERRRDETVELLQELGLKEYEARCFVALTQIPAATAKEISDISEVPRTQVYDAIRVLEGKGLVEVQHANPKRFRAVDVEEGVATLRQRFDDRLDTLQTHLERLDIQPETEAAERVQEVWSLSGSEAIQSRMLDRFEAADSEVVLLVVDEDLLTTAVFERLREAVERGVDVVVGARNDAVVSRVAAELPSATVFRTELGWLVGAAEESEVAISRLALVDRTALLVSSFYPAEGTEGSEEQAIVADGLENGVVVLVRRLIASGLSPANAGGTAASH